MKLRDFLTEMRMPRTEEFFLDEFENIRQITRIKDGYVYFEGAFEGEEVPVDNLMNTGRYHNGVTLWTYTDIVEYGEPDV
jgi:hypothetical protein